MGLSCGMSVVKYGIFISNFFFAIFGIALIVAGSIPLVKLDDIRDAFPNDNPATVPVMVLVLGSIIFIISFFGCCGAIRESQCMVTTYAFFLLLLVVLQIVLAVFAFLYTKELADASREGFAKLWTEMSRGDRKSEEAIHGIQRGLQCCGNNGPTDWILPPLNGVPSSCCEDNPDSCNILNSFRTGCQEVLGQLVEGSGLLIAWFAACFGGLMLVGLIFACCLANSIRNTTRRQYA